MNITPRTIRIRSSKRLKGLNQYQVQEEHAGKRGERSVYLYQIPREFEAKAIGLGGELATTEGLR